MTSVAAAGRRTVVPALLAIFVASLPLMDLEVFRLGGKSIVLPYVMLAIVAAAVLLQRGLVQPYLREDSALPFLAGWIVIAFCSGAVAFLRSQDAALLASNARQFANVAYMAVHYAVVAAALRSCSDRELLSIRDTFVLAACAGALLSAYQIGSVVFSWPYAEWLRTSNLYFKANTLNWHGGGSWIALPRAFGPAPEPTFWAGYLGIALAFALGRLSEGLRWRYGIEAAIVAIALVLTFSRAAAPPVLAMILVWLIARRWMPGWLIPAAVATVFAATVAPALMNDRWLGLLPDHSSAERLSAQVTGLRMVGDYPILGIGPGSVASFVDRYLFVIEGRQNIGFSRLYSFTLTVMVTTGLAGAALFAAYLLEVGRREFRALTAATSPQMRGLALSSLLTFICIVVYWLGSPAYNMSFLWFALAFGSALGARPAVADKRSWSASA
jgi:hypothetical protein